MNLIKICISDDFEVDYDKERGMYRVSIFDDGHFWDEYWFDAYEDKEVDNRIEKIIDKLEELKVNFKKYMDINNCRLDSTNIEYFFSKLIECIKDIKENP